jgi:biopolymer transport protein ExbD
MPSIFHRAKQRRQERAPTTEGGGINLVPLVDILTSIVFFSLLTYSGERMEALTAYDLALPPALVTSPDQTGNLNKNNTLDMVLAVKIEPTKMTVEHSVGPFHRDIAGTDEKAMDQLQAQMTEIHNQYATNNDVNVIPADDVSYDTVVKVLERLRMARYTGISLNAKARGGIAAGGGR